MPRIRSGRNAAAELSGETLTGFVLGVATERAEQVLERARRIGLRAEAFDRDPGTLSRESLRAVAPLSPAHDVERFDCGVDGLDRWLRHSARVAAAAGTAATYVLCRGEQRVVGYYALAMSAVRHERAASRLRRGMPDPVPVVLLTRLALDQAEHGSGLGGYLLVGDQAEHGSGLGGYLLVGALERCLRGGREFGARAVVVGAVNEQAGAFYRHFGFHRSTSSGCGAGSQTLSAPYAADEERVPAVPAVGIRPNLDRSLTAAPRAGRGAGTSA
jgi:predicted GNAT family N-acyltransferase